MPWPKKFETEINCPKCSRAVRVRVEQMYPGGVVRCLCGAQLNFTGDDGRKTQRAFDELRQTIEKFGR